jgi:hypothetical protein
MTAILAFVEAAKGILSAAVSFFSKPPGSYVGLVLAAIFALLIAHSTGYSAGQAASEAAHVAKVEQEAQRQRTVAAAVVARSEDRTNQNIAADQKAQEEVRHVKNEAQAQPAADTVCISASLADRVRDIP